MDPFGLLHTGENRQQRQQRVYTSPSEKLDKGNLLQQFLGTCEQAKEAKSRRGVINDNFRAERKKAQQQWREEDKRVREQDRREKEDLNRYYNVYSYNPGSDRWKDATARVEKKFAEYKKYSKRDTADRRRQQMWELQRQRDASVRQMWKALKGAGEGDQPEVPRGERLL